MESPVIDQRFNKTQSQKEYKTACSLFSIDLSQVSPWSPYKLKKGGVGKESVEE